MLIQERSVTKYYWLKMYRKLFRKIQAGTYKRVGQTGVLVVTFGTRHRYYVLTAKEKGHLRPVAWLYLWQKPGWKAWEVMQVFVFEKLRGQGLAKKLYSAAINQDELIVASGKTHSSHSRGLWRSFVRNGNYSIYAIDYWCLSDRSQVFWNEGELWSTLDLYQTDPNYQERDVRLIATRKQT